MVWSGWQADVAAGGGRMTMSVPIAHRPDGAEITGRVRGEYVVNAATSTQNLSSGSFTGLTHTSYETVSLDTRDAALTLRVKETDPRIAIAVHRLGVRRLHHGAVPRDAEHDPDLPPQRLRHRPHLRAACTRRRTRR